MDSPYSQIQYLELTPSQKCTFNTETHAGDAPLLVQGHVQSSDEFEQCTRPQLRSPTATHVSSCPLSKCRLHSPSSAAFCAFFADFFRDFKLLEMVPKHRAEVLSSAPSEQEGWDVLPEKTGLLGELCSGISNSAAGRVFDATASTTSIQ